MGEYKFKEFFVEIKTYELLHNYKNYALYKVRDEVGRTTYNLYLELSIISVTEDYDSAYALFNKYTMED